MAHLLRTIFSSFLLPLGASLLAGIQSSRRVRGRGLNEDETSILSRKVRFFKTQKREQ